MAIRAPDGANNIEGTEIDREVLRDKHVMSHSETKISHFFLKGQFLFLPPLTKQLLKSPSTSANGIEEAIFCYLKLRKNNFFLN